MKNRCFHLLFWVVLFNQVSAQQPDYNAVVNKYVQQYKGIAVNEMKVYHIPASITLAQGILESNAGRSDLAVVANNHFGIKCHKEWTGMTFYKDDETKNECFRKYDDPLQSFRDHSQFLTTRDRYKVLFSLDITDYKGWAKGLKAAGYATNPAYPQLLIKTIETFYLYTFDSIDPEVAEEGIAGKQDKPEKKGRLPYIVVSTRPDGRIVYENNPLSMIIAGEADNIYSIAGDFSISVEKLLKYNDLREPSSMKPGQIVYLEPKRRKGSSDFHRFAKGETLYSISQMYGVKLKLLVKRNGQGEGAEPGPGTILRLR
jgi:hypothetical protein